MQSIQTKIMLYTTCSKYENKDNSFRTIASFQAFSPRVIEKFVDFNPTVPEPRAVNSATCKLPCLAGAAFGTAKIGNRCRGHLCDYGAHTKG